MPRFSLRYLMLTVFWVSLVLGLVAFLAQNVPRWQAQSERRQAEHERQQQADQLEIKQLIKDLDGINAKLGRYPNDEAEVIQLRGKPMPVTHSSDDAAHPVRYTKDHPMYALHFTY